MMNVKIISLITAAALITGCAATMKSSVLDRAAFDLDCPKDKISLVEIGNRTYGAKGCDKRESYILVGECSLPSSCVALINSSD